MSNSDVLLFIDAIDDDEAVVLVGERRYRLPRAVLPTDAKEGAWLRIRIDTSSTVGAEIDIERTRLVGADDGGNIKL
jgi:hypothetical protein